MGKLSTYHTLAVVLRIIPAARVFKENPPKLQKMWSTPSVSRALCQTCALVLNVYLQGFFGWLVLFCFSNWLFLSFFRSYLHSAVHSPPAALACEGVRLSATMDMTQARIASSSLETENVSLL